MAGKTVATIYFYVISAGSIILLVIAVFSWANLILNLTQYDQYPLRYSGQASCQADPYKSAPYPVGMNGQMASPSASEQVAARADCLKQEELDRKQYKLDDTKDVVVYTLVGLILFGIHFPMARKQSKN